MWKLFAALGLVVAPLPAPAGAQADVGKAVAKAAEFFKARAKQGLAGGPGGGYGNGETALMGLAMLEAGIPPSDPSMKLVIDSVRNSALAQTQTYPVSLSVLFLDRLGDPTDVPTIQMLGVRLYAGMNANGGWGYATWDATPDANELARLNKALQGRELVGEAMPQKPGTPGDFDKPAPGEKPPARVGKLHSEVQKVADAVGGALRARGRAFAGDDNSNTQFGMTALWVACRNGLPARDAFDLVERRFVAAQNPRDGGWGYTNPGGLAGMVSGSTPAMTCAGLLGLALGSGARKATLTADAAKPRPDDRKTIDDDPFSNPSVAAAPAKPAAKGKDDGRPPADLPKTVQAALVSFGQFLQAAKAGGPGVGGGPGARGLGNLGGFVGAGNSYYLLWSMERMAVAYSLDTIGGVNWYEFGSSLLLPAQGPDGSWNDGSYGPEVNTAFAVLFLTKSNLVSDLTGKIKGTKDPGKTELRGSNGPPLLAPPPKDPPQQGGSKPAAPSAGPAAQPATGGFTLPPVVMPTEAAEAEKLAAAILAATDDWDQKLGQARVTKGGKWSRALATVCGKADGDKRKQARDALANRLTRMTAGTLKAMLNDTDAELRRAACLAVAMKEETPLTGDVIDRLADVSDSVGRAARAALKSLSGVDFGPPAGADDDAKRAATAAWRAWLEAKKN